MPISLRHAAETLDDVYRTLTPEPLREQWEFKTFYSEKLDEVRGGSKIGPMVTGLNRAFGASSYKTFFIGHPGVGKSTEMYRLEDKVSSKFRTVRFEAPRDLNAAGFQPYDVLLVIMIKLAEELERLSQSGRMKGNISPDLIQQIRLWFATAKYTDTTTNTVTISGEAGIKPSPVADTFAGLLGLFGSISGQIKYNDERREEVIVTRRNTVDQLIRLLNRFLDEANIILKASEHREWLIIGEDFDKQGIPQDAIESLFVNNANVFRDLKGHLIFNIPVWLAYSSNAMQLPYPPCIIYDTPVYTPQHESHDEGRQALQDLLATRIKPELFAEGQQERLIVASAGNLNDLFRMTTQAADFAALRPGNRGIIETSDVTRVINEWRTRYIRAIGQSPNDKVPLTYEDKVKRLLAIYHQQGGNDQADPILHHLLKARAVQEFNGIGWFGVHPLIVDMLVRDGKLATDDGSRPLGGSI